MHDSYFVSPSVQVRFVGEGAVDHGGPRREFFRLLAIEAQENLLRGPPTAKFFDTNVSAVKVSLYQGYNYVFLIKFLYISYLQSST